MSPTPRGPYCRLHESGTHWPRQMSAIVRSRTWGASTPVQFRHKQGDRLCVLLWCETVVIAGIMNVADDASSLRTTFQPRGPVSWRAELATGSTGGLIGSGHGLHLFRLSGGNP